MIRTKKTLNSKKQRRIDSRKKKREESNEREFGNFSQEKDVSEMNQYETKSKEATCMEKMIFQPVSGGERDVKV